MQEYAGSNPVIPTSPAGDLKSALPVALARRNGSPVGGLPSWLHHLVVRIRPSQGRYTGSNPVGAIQFTAASSNGLGTLTFNQCNASSNLVAAM